MATKHEISVSPATMARLSGITRQSIHDACKSGAIVKTGKKISLENPVNRAFLENHGGNLEEYLRDPLHGKEKRRGSKKAASEAVKHELEAQGLKEDLTKDEIEKLLMLERRKKLQIENEVMMNNLVEKKLVKSVLGHIGQAIKMNFIDYPRRESALLAAELAAPGKEKQIENFLSNGIAKSLGAMKEEVARLSQDEIYR